MYKYDYTLMENLLLLGKFIFSFKEMTANLDITKSEKYIHYIYDCKILFIFNKF